MRTLTPPAHAPWTAVHYALWIKLLDMAEDDLISWDEALSYRELLDVRAFREVGQRYQCPIDPQCQVTSHHTGPGSVTRPQPPRQASGREQTSGPRHLIKHE